MPQLALVVEPAAAVGQPRMDPVPAGRDRRAVAGGVGAGHVLLDRPGRGPIQAISRPCSVGDGHPRRPWRLGSRRTRRSAAARPTRRQIGQDIGKPGDVVAAVGHDHDVGIVGLPVPGDDQPVDHFAELGRGDRGSVVGRAEPHSVQHRGPRTAPGLQRGDEGVGPARDQLGVVLGAAVDVAEQPVTAGRRVRAQPRADIAASTIRPPTLGSGNDARLRRSRASSTCPAFSASYMAPCPRRCSAVRSARPARSPARRRTTRHPSTRTAHPPARSSRRRTPGETRPNHPARTQGHPTRSCGHTPHCTHGHRLVFRLCERNPKRIKRWPCHVPPTRRTTCSNSSPRQQQGKSA